MYTCVVCIVYGDEGWLARPARFDKVDMYDDYNEFTRTAAAEYNVSPCLHLCIVYSMCMYFVYILGLCIMDMPRFTLALTLTS